MLLGSFEAKRTLLRQECFYKSAGNALSSIKRINRSTIFPKSKGKISISFFFLLITAPNLTQIHIKKHCHTIFFILFLIVFSTLTAFLLKSTRARSSSAFYIAAQSPLLARSFKKILHKFFKKNGLCMESTKNAVSGKRDQE